MHGLLKRYFQGITQIGPAVDTRSASGLAPCGTATENLAENIAEVAGVKASLAETAEAPEAARSACGARIDAGFAEAVIGGLLLGVGEDRVGLTHLLKFFLGRLVTVIAVGVILHGQSPISFFDVLIGGVAGYAQYLVIILISHFLTQSLVCCRTNERPEGLG